MAEPALSQQSPPRPEQQQVQGHEQAQGGGGKPANTFAQSASSWAMKGTALLENLMQQPGDEHGGSRHGGSRHGGGGGWGSRHGGGGDDAASTSTSGSGGIAGANANANANSNAPDPDDDDGDTIQDLRARNASLTERSAIAEANLLNQLAELSSALSAKSNEINALKSSHQANMEDLEKQVHFQADQLRERDDSLQRVEAMNEALRHDLHAMQNGMEETVFDSLGENRARVVAFERENKMLFDQVNTTKDLNQTQSKDIEEFKSRVEELEQEVQQKDSLLDKTVGRLEEVTAKYKAMSSTLKDTQKQCYDMQGELNDLREREEKGGEKKHAWDGIVTEDEEETVNNDDVDAVSREEFEEVRQKCTDLESRLEQSESRCGELESELDGARTRCSELTESVASLTADLESATAERDAAVARADSLVGVSPEQLRSEVSAARMQAEAAARDELTALEESHGHRLAQAVSNAKADAEVEFRRQIEEERSELEEEKRRTLEELRLENEGVLADAIAETKAEAENEVADMLVALEDERNAETERLRSEWEAQRDKAVMDAVSEAERDLMDRIVELEGEHSDAVEKLEDAVRDSESRADAAEEKVKALEGDVAELRRKLDEAEAELEKAKRAHEEEISALQLTSVKLESDKDSEIAAAVARLAGADEEKLSLERTAEDLRERLEMSDHKIVQMEAVVESLQDQLAKEKERQADQTGSISRSLTENGGDESAATTTVASAELTADWEEKLSDRDATITTLLRASQDQDEALAAAQEENEELRTKVEELSEQLLNSSSLNQSESEELQEQVQKLSEELLQLSSVNSENINLRRQMQDKTREVSDLSSLQSDNDGLRRQVEEQVSQLSSLQSELSSVNSQNEGMEKKTTKQLRQLATFKQCIDMHKQREEKLSAEVKELRDQLCSLMEMGTSRVAELELDVENARSSTTELESEIRSLKSKLAEEQSRAAEELESEIRSLKSKLAEQQSRAEEDMRSAEEMLDEEQRRTAEVKEEYEAKLSERDAAIAAMVKASVKQEERVKSLQSDVDRLRGEMRSMVPLSKMQPVETLREENEMFAAQIIEQDSEMEDLRAKLSYFEKYGAPSSGSSTANKGDNSQLERMQSANMSLNREVMEMRKQLTARSVGGSDSGKAELESQLEELRVSLSAVKRENRRLQDQLDVAMQKQFKKELAKASSIPSETTDSADVAELRRKISSLEREKNAINEEMEKQLRSNDKAVRVLEESSTRQKQKIDYLKEELEKYQGIDGPQRNPLVRSSSAGRQGDRNDNDFLKARNAKLQMELTEMKARVEEEEAGRTIFENNTFETFEKKLSLMKLNKDAALDSLRKEVAALKGSKKQMEIELMNQITALESVNNGSKSELEIKLQQKEKIITILEQKVAAHERVVHHMRTEMDQLQGGMEKVNISRRGELEELHQELMDGTARIKKQDREIAALKMKLEERRLRHTNEMEKYKSKISSLEIDSPMMRGTQAAKDSMKIDELNKKIQELNWRITTLTEDNSKLRMRLEKVDAEAKEFPKTDRWRTKALKEQVKVLTVRVKELEGRSGSQSRSRSRRRNGVETSGTNASTGRSSHDAASAVTKYTF